MVATRCIYTVPHGLCLGDTPFDNEHGLSFGLGNFCGHEPISDKICKDCNHRCSKLEERLLHLGPVALLRRFAGIKGRSRGRGKDIFYESTFGLAPIAVTGAPSPGHHDVRWEVKYDYDGVPLRQIVFKNPTGELRVVPLRRGVTSISNLRAFLIASDLGDFQPVEIYPDPQDTDDFERLAQVCEGLYRRRFSKVRVEAGGVVNATTQFAPPPEYRRAIAKIGFHFFLKVFPEVTGFESEFNEIKKLIMRGGDPVQFVHEQAGKIPRGVVDQGSWAHLLYADWGLDFLKTRVQLFAGLTIPASGSGVPLDSFLGGKTVKTNSATNPLTWVVHLGRSPAPKRTLGTRAMAFVAGKAPKGFDGRAWVISDRLDVQDA